MKNNVCYLYKDNLNCNYYEIYLLIERNDAKHAIYTAAILLRCDIFCSALLIFGEIMIMPEHSQIQISTYSDAHHHVLLSLSEVDHHSTS